MCPLLETYSKSFEIEELRYIGEKLFGESSHYLLCSKKHSAIERAKFKAIVELLGFGVPIQQIVGYAHFGSEKIGLRLGEFVPRQYSELLVEHSVEFLRGLKREVSLLEAFAGSGAIALAIAANFSQLQLTLLESKEYSNWRKIKQKLQIARRREELGALLFDLIVANPPYLPSEALALTESSLLNYEGEESLRSDGEHLTLLYQLAERHLRVGGLLLFEHWLDEGERISELFESYKIYGIYSDGNFKHRFTALLK
jgi:release factor glutamine methyltransferase